MIDSLCDSFVDSLSFMCYLAGAMLGFGLCIVVILATFASVCKLGEWICDAIDAIKKYKQDAKLTPEERKEKRDKELEITRNRVKILSAELHRLEDRAQNTCGGDDNEN